MKLSTLLESNTKKYEFVPDDTIIVSRSKLTRIRALIDIPKYKVFKGELGGYIEKESNLSHEGDCWIGRDAQVYDNAKVFGNAEVSGNTEVSGNAILCNNSWYFNKMLWLDDSTQESLDSFANDKIINLQISNCSINKLIGFNQVEYLQLNTLEEFSLKTLPAKLVKLVINHNKILKHLPYLVTKKNELITNNHNLIALIPEFTRLQNDNSDKDIAMLEIQQALIEAGFSEEEYEI